MSTTKNNAPGQDFDERDRQIKQAEMIRQYLQVTNVNTNSLPVKRSVSESVYQPPATNVALPLSSFNFNELRSDLKMAEERVERLRQELKEIQNKRDESFLRPPPPPYVSPPIYPANTDLVLPYLSATTNRTLADNSTSSLVQEMLFSHQQRQTINNEVPHSVLLSNLKTVGHLSPTPGGVNAASADLSKDHRQHQLLRTMHQHREQLAVYLDSLKQALNSLDRLASLEPTRSEIHLTNMKLDTIQQKSRQLRALKSNRSSQQSPFIECRIRQLEHDLVYMLSEHQKDVQAKLELNEQRSLMLLKIIQINDELISVDNQIQQLATADLQRTNSLALVNEINQQQQFSRVVNSPTNSNSRRVSFRELNGINSPVKLNNVYYQYH